MYIYISVENISKAFSFFRFSLFSPREQERSFLLSFFFVFDTRAGSALKRTAKQTECVYDREDARNDVKEISA